MKFVVIVEMTVEGDTEDEVEVGMNCALNNLVGSDIESVDIIDVRRVTL